LPFGLTQPKERPRLLQQLSRFYLLPFPRKKLGDLYAPRMMATVPHITSGSGLRKFQADGFLLDRVYNGIFIIVILNKIQRNIGLWLKQMLSFL